MEDYKERTAVNSSNIGNITYSPHTHLLRVSFLNGTIYDYYDVDDKTYRNFMDAPSKGTFFSKNIRGKFRYKKI